MTATRTIRIGTRASLLARTQTQHVADALGTSSIEIVPIVTAGDRSAASLSQLIGGTPANGGVAGGGGTGVFVSALREALLAGEIDVAVHSFKDLPTAPAEGIVIGAVPLREDPRDALVARDGLTLGELPQGARVGTGAPRRAAQLRALGLGLQILDLRGNVDTRLGKVASGELDAVVLALAGLRRLGRDGEVSEILDPIQVLPAPAQGALAIECRADDERVLAAVAALDHLDTRAAVAAERAVLAALEAGCSAPVGALAVVAEGDDGPEVFLRASVTAVDGSAAVRQSATGAVTDAEGVGRRLAADLLADGADQMMAVTQGRGRDGESST
jgi:hydroxymethylbilane synthase